MDSFFARLGRGRHSMYAVIRMQRQICDERSKCVPELLEIDPMTLSGAVPKFVRKRLLSGLTTGSISATVISKTCSPNAPSRSATCVHAKPHSQPTMPTSSAGMVGGHSQGLRETIHQRFQYTASGAAFCSITTFLPPYRPNSTVPMALTVPWVLLVLMAQPA